MNEHLFFREQLLAWFAQHHRPLPWKGERDPYKIWLSEIILQQTRVEQGLPYYHRFTARYPTVHHLANAPEDEVLKLWEGLGYYARARNLHFTAKYISDQLKGKFPDTFANIRALKGVGDYTAAAIASFAFDLPHAVLDGNVYRVLARYFGNETPIDTPHAKKEFAALAQQLLDPARPGDYNQAIMDFGATHCTPQQPKCPSCPLQNHCVALRTERVATLPAKSRAPVKKDRFFLYLVPQFQGDTFVRKRTDKDIWQNLWEFPMLELPALPKNFEEELNSMIPKGGSMRFSRPYRQTLTHRVVTAIFCEIDFPENTPSDTFDRAPFEGCTRIPKTNLKKNIAMPRIIDQYLRESALSLSLF